MRLFKIFRKLKADTSANEGTLFYHEDDYCQVELSPKENLPLFQKESEEITDLAGKSFDGYGYTDIYVRNDNRVELRERKINPGELEQIISEMGLNKATKVVTGYGETYRQALKDTVGFGGNYSAVYFDFRGNVVNHIWFTDPFGIETQRLTQCLLDIGERWSLLLMDWNQTLLVDLSKKNEIEKYLIR